LLFYSVSLNAFGQEWIFKELFTSRDFANVEFRSYFYSSEGFIYLGTTGGLFKTDGYNKSQIPLPDSLKNESITSIVEYSPGLVLLGTGTGHLLKIHLPEGETEYITFAGAEIKDIWVSREKVIWVATYGNGLIHYDDSLSTTNEVRGLLDDYCYCLEPDFRGRIWVGTDRGINILTADGSIIRSIAQDEGLPDVLVTALHEDDKNRMWVGMETAGICYIDMRPGIEKVILPDSSWEYGMVTAILQSDNDIIAGTRSNGILNLTNIISYEPITGISSYLHLRKSYFLMVKQSSYGRAWMASVFTISMPCMLMIRPCFGSVSIIHYTSLIRNQEKYLSKSLKHCRQAPSSACMKILSVIYGQVLSEKVYTSLINKPFR
jgi:hypothetical protein